MGCAKVVLGIYLLFYHNEHQTSACCIQIIIQMDYADDLCQLKIVVWLLFNIFLENKS